MRTWRSILAGTLLALGIGAFAQAPPPSPSEQELRAPITLDDGKPTQAASQAGGPSGWRAFGSMVLVLGLAGGALYAFKRWGAKRLPGSGGTRLKVEEGLALGERRFVSILRADGDLFLIATTPQAVTLLARMDGVEAAPPPSFGEALEGQLELGRPMPVKDVEAMILKGERP